MERAPLLRHLALLPLELRDLLVDVGSRPAAARAEKVETVLNPRPASREASFLLVHLFEPAVGFHETGIGGFPPVR